MISFTKCSCSVIPYLQCFGSQRVWKRGEEKQARSGSEGRIKERTKWQCSNVALCTTEEEKKAFLFVTCDYRRRSEKERGRMTISLFTPFLFCLLSPPLCRATARFLMGKGGVREGEEGNCSLFAYFFADLASFLPVSFLYPILAFSSFLSSFSLAAIPSSFHPGKRSRRRRRRRRRRGEIKA